MEVAYTLMAAHHWKPAEVREMTGSDVMLALEYTVKRYKPTYQNQQPDRPHRSSNVSRV